MHVYIFNDVGPGGVLICCRDAILYKNQDHATIRTILPKRYGLDNQDNGTLVTCFAAHQQKNLFF